ncbi:MAG: hypothetical protein ACRD3T_19565 [Terriglobia bacterium]
MHMVKDLSTEELKALIGEVVEEKLRELLADPDAGLAIRRQDRVARHGTNVTSDVPKGAVWDSSKLQGW